MRRHVAARDLRGTGGKIAARRGHLKAPYRRGSRVSVHLIGSDLRKLDSQPPPLARSPSEVRLRETLLTYRHTTLRHRTTHSPHAHTRSTKAPASASVFSCTARRSAGPRNPIHCDSVGITTAQ